MAPSLSIDVLEKTDDRIKIKFTDVPRPYVNALRRISISEVPTLAIDDVVVLENSSVMHDEAIAHRLGLIPLLTDLARFVMPHSCDCKSTLGCSKCRVLLVLDSEAHEKTKVVTTAELISEDEIVKPVSKDIPIVVLAPAEKIKFEAYARLGVGRNHAKWQPTSAAIVSDGDEGNESILTIETNGALKAEDTVLTAIDIINSKIKNFHHVVRSLELSKKD